MSTVISVRNLVKTYVVGEVQVKALRGINLSRLESRPWTGRGSRWEYLFWVDLDASAEDEACRAALKDLEEETEVVRILGSYPSASED